MLKTDLDRKAPLGDELAVRHSRIRNRWKKRLVETVFPKLIHAFFEQRRLAGHNGRPSRDVLDEAFSNSLGLLFQSLFKLFANARRLVPQNHLRHGPDVTLGRSLGVLNSQSHSERILTQVIQCLSQYGDDNGSPSELVDYQTLDLAFLGEIYEVLLQFKLVVVGDERETKRFGNRKSARPTITCHENVCLVPDHQHRRQVGAYYTSPRIIHFILEQTLEPVLQRKLESLRSELQDCRTADPVARHELLKRLLDFRVLDPAMGCGRFLIEAVKAITERLLEYIASFGFNLLSLLLQQTRHDICKRFRLHDSTDESMPSDADLLKRLVLKNCVFGIDLDETAVEIARLTLWLDAGIVGDLFDCFDNHLRYGDALLDDQFGDLDGAQRFDCDVVIGNPPYGAKLANDVKTILRKRWPLMKSNSDTAVGFMQMALQTLREGGRAGLIVPKALTYSYAWRHVRKLVNRRVFCLADVSRAWKDVRLEQVIAVFCKVENSDDYHCYDGTSGEISNSSRLSWTWAERFDTLPCTLNGEELNRLNRLRCSDTTIGDVVKTFRGLAIQRSLVDDGNTKVIGGRDLQRWRVRSCSGFAPVDGNYEPFRQEKLVFQNIVAHVTNPSPRILLTGAYDDQQTVTLDTVNNLVPRDGAINLRGLLGLLHSELINWFVYAIVYNKAIRTMHFDQYFLDKIPLPVDFEVVLDQIAPLAVDCEVATHCLAQLCHDCANVIQSETGVGLKMDDIETMLCGKKFNWRRFAKKENSQFSKHDERRCEEIVRTFQRQFDVDLKGRARAVEMLDRIVNQAYGDPTQRSRTSQQNN